MPRKALKAKANKGDRVRVLTDNANRSRLSKGYIGKVHSICSDADRRDGETFTNQDTIYVVDEDDGADEDEGADGCYLREQDYEVVEDKPKNGGGKSWAHYAKKR